MRVRTGSEPLIEVCRSCNRQFIKIRYAIIAQQILYFCSQDCRNDFIDQKRSSK